MIIEDGTSTITVGPFMGGTLAECSESLIKAHAEKGVVRIHFGDGEIAVCIPERSLGSLRDVLTALLVVTSRPG